MWTQNACGCGFVHLLHSNTWDNVRPYKTDEASTLTHTQTDTRLFIGIWFSFCRNALRLHRRFSSISSTIYDKPLSICFSNQIFYSKCYCCCCCFYGKFPSYPLYVLFQTADINQGVELEPEFLGSISNVTYPVGREAVLTCSVKNLGKYKVSVL